MSAPAAPPVPAELEALLRRMRLPYLRQAAPDVLATARAQRWDPAEVLRVLLAEEVTGRDAATRRTRRKTANFPAGKTFATWRPAESSIPAPTQNALATLEWIGRAENLAVAGPSGTGKSHFVEALAHAAIDNDLRVAWFTLESLAATIGRAKADASIARTVARICRSDLIVRRRHRHAARRAGRRRGVLPHHRRRLRTPLASQSPATSTPPGSTPSCPRPSPPPPSTGCCTTPTSCRPAATPTASPRPSPAREWSPCPNHQRSQEDTVALSSLSPGQGRRGPARTGSQLLPLLVLGLPV